MTRRAEQIDREATVKRVELLLDQLGRSFAADLAVAELERRADDLDQSLASTCKRAGKLGAK